MTDEQQVVGADDWHPISSDEQQVAEAMGDKICEWLDTESSQSSVADFLAKRIIAARDAAVFAMRHHNRAPFNEAVRAANAAFLRGLRGESDDD